MYTLITLKYSHHPLWGNSMMVIYIYPWFLLLTETKNAPFHFLSNYFIMKTSVFSLIVLLYLRSSKGFRPLKSSENSKQ